MSGDALKVDLDQIRSLASDYARYISNVERACKTGTSEAERAINRVASIYKKYDYVQSAISRVRSSVSNVDSVLSEFKQISSNMPNVLKSVVSMYREEEASLKKTFITGPLSGINKICDKKATMKVFGLNDKVVDKLSTQEEYKKYVLAWLLMDEFTSDNKDIFTRFKEGIQKRLLFEQAHKYYADKDGVYLNINGEIYKNFQKVTDLSTVPKAIKEVTVEDLYDLEPVENDPIQVSVEGNTVKIKLYINFTGDANVHFIDASGNDTGKTYADLAKEGIIDQWGVNFNGSDYDFMSTVKGKVEVEIIDMVPGQTYFNDPDQQYLNVNIDASIPTAADLPAASDLATATSDEKHVPHNHSGNWSMEDGDFGKIDMFIGDGRSVISGGKYEYSEKSFKATIAHEIGHSLGLGDAYLADLPGTGGKGLTSNAEVTKGSSFGDYKGSIMWANGHATANDVEMVLEAFKTGIKQSYGVAGIEGTSTVIRLK